MSHEQEDLEPAATTSNSASDWFDESIAFLAGDLGHAFEGFGWWSAPSTAQEQRHAGSLATETLPYQSVLPQPGPNPGVGCATPSAVASPQELVQTKKRKSAEHVAPPGQMSQSQRSQVGPDPGKTGASGNRKPSKKGGAAGMDRDARWAEQLLNPCAAAIEEGNLPRAQHLLYVLGELASFSGDPNHRLTAHGLRALALRLPAAVGQAAAASVKMPPLLERPTPAFQCAEPRLFRAALIKFHEVSPWFALPNALANAAITQLLSKGAAGDQPLRKIRVVDVSVSHGVQWPTLLDALTRVPRGFTPPSIRLTIAGPTATSPAPFATSPPSYDSAPQLLRYARSIDLDLAIYQAPRLDTLHGVAPSSEVLVVCIQFRISHATSDEQAAVLRKIRNLDPELVFLAELDGGGRSDGGGMSSEFAARLELLWSFLESTAAAFKGKDADERRVMEAEAGTALTTAWRGATVDGREAWRARMAAAGFVEAAFGGEALETAKSLLRKYDGGWELVPPSPETGAAVGLRWKGQPVSFCSLWRPA